MNINSKLGGFSLIEVLVTMGIIGIAAAIAIPSYDYYATRGKIPEATAALAAKRIQAEQFFQDNRRYDDGAWGTNPACQNDATTSKFFRFSCTVQTQVAYTIQAQAVPTESMNGFTFTIDQNNVRMTTGVPTSKGWSLPATNCWVIKKDGSC